MLEVIIQNLSVRFGDGIALDRVDLRVAAGELFLLLGPSGSGKTTLLRCIAGFISPQSGSIRFGDEDVTRLAPHLRGTAMVFQSFALWPHLSVAENVGFGLRERRVERKELEQRVAQALDAMRMGNGYAERRIDQLSGGEQQRVALARALVVRPRCLLLDEPLSNLDAKLRHSMRDEIRRVCKEQKLTAVYVTHDQKEALAVADRIALMKGGRIQQIGTPHEIYREPVSRSVASFIGETNLLEGTVRERSANDVRVTTSIGEFASSGRSGFQPAAGDKVWISLRPECLRLGRDDGAPQANAVRGTVTASTYLGEIAEHRFRTGSETLRVYELNPVARAWPEASPGVVTVAAADVVLLPHEGADA